MSLTHNFTLTFAVPGSMAVDASDVTPDMILAALLARVAELEVDPENLRENIEGPRSSTDLVDWVLRKKAEPGVIRQSDGGWITVTEGAIRIEDMLPSAQASNMPPGRHGFWCKAVDAFDVEVLADLHSDDRVIDTQVDIRPWLAQATVDEIAEMEAEGWGYGEAPDRVAHFMEGIGNPDACRLFNYLGLRPRMSVTGDDVGFGLSVAQGDAVCWLERHRPDIISIIRPEEPTP